MLILIAVGLEVAPSPGERPSYLRRQRGSPSREEFLGDPRVFRLPSRKRPLLPRTVTLAQAVTREPRPVPPSLDSAPLPAGVSSAIFFVPGFLLLVPGGAKGLRGGPGRGRGAGSGRGLALTGPAPQSTT